MLILIGKSGSGKTTIREALVKDYGFKKAVSHTTRPMRADDIPDETYHFVSEEKFNRLVATGEIVESTVACYDGNYYGMSRAEMSNDSVAIFEVEGAKNAKTIHGITTVVVYLHTSTEERKRRLLARGDAIERIEKRLVSDEESFKEAKDICNYIIPADKYTPDDIANCIANILSCEN